jgi:ribosomal protein L19E
MKTLRKGTLYLASAAVLGLSVVAAPVYARQGSDNHAISGSTTTTETETHSGSGSSGSGSSGSGSQTKKIETSHTENEVEDQAREDTAKAKGAELLAEAKKEHKAKNKEERQKTCETRKGKFEARASAMVKNAQKHQLRIDGVLSKAVDYKTTNNLTVTDYDALLAAATAAQATSQASVTALKNLQPTLDCTNESVASNIAAFKAATDQARSDLNAYKKSARALFTAIENAKGTNEGGTQ